MDPWRPDCLHLQKVIRFLLDLGRKNPDADEVYSAADLTSFAMYFKCSLLCTRESFPANGTCLLTNQAT